MKNLNNYYDYDSRVISRASNIQNSKTKDDTLDMDTNKGMLLCVTVLVLMSLVVLRLMTH